MKTDLTVEDMQWLMLFMGMAGGHISNTNREHLYDNTYFRILGKLIAIHDALVLEASRETQNEKGQET